MCFLNLLLIKIRPPDTLPEWSVYDVYADNIRNVDVDFEGKNYNYIIHGSISVKKFGTTTYSTFNFTENHGTFKFSSISVQNSTIFPETLKELTISNKISMPYDSFSDIQANITNIQSLDIEIIVNQPDVYFYCDQNEIIFADEFSTSIDTTKLSSLQIAYFQESFPLFLLPKDTLRFMPDMKFMNEKGINIYISAEMSNSKIFGSNFKKGKLSCAHSVTIYTESDQNPLSNFFELDSTLNLKIISEYLHGNYDLYTSFDEKDPDITITRYAFPKIQYVDAFIPYENKLNLILHGSSLNESNNSVEFEFNKKIDVLTISSVDIQSHIILVARADKLVLSNVHVYLFSEDISIIEADSSSYIEFLGESFVGKSLTCLGEVNTSLCLSIDYEIITCSFVSLKWISKVLANSTTRIVNLDVNNYDMAPRIIKYAGFGIYLTSTHGSFIMNYPTYKQLNINGYNISNKFNSHLYVQHVENDEKNILNITNHDKNNKWEINIAAYQRESNTKIIMRNMEVYSLIQEKLDPKSFSFISCRHFDREYGHYCIVKDYFSCSYCPQEMIPVLNTFYFNRLQSKNDIVQILTTSSINISMHSISKTTVIVSTYQNKLVDLTITLSNNSNVMPTMLVVKNCRLLFSGHENINIEVEQLALLQNSEILPSEHKIFASQSLIASPKIIDSLLKRLLPSKNLEIHFVHSQTSTKVTKIDVSNDYLSVFYGEKSIKLIRNNFNCIFVKDMAYDDKSDAIVLKSTLKEYTEFWCYIRIFCKTNKLYVNITGYKDEFFYMNQSYAGVFIDFEQSNSKLYISSDTKYTLMADIIRVPAPSAEKIVELNYNGQYCLYDKDSSECHPKSQKIKVSKSDKITSDMFKSFYLENSVDVQLSLSFDNLLFDSDIFEKYSVNFYSSKMTKIDVLPSKSINNKIILTNVTINIKNEGNFELIDLRKGKIVSETNKLTGKLKINWQNIDSLNYFRVVDLDVVLDDSKHLNFYQNEIQIDSQKIDLKKVTSLNFYLYKPSTEVSQISLCQNGLNNTNPMLITPKFNIFTFQETYFYLSSDFENFNYKSSEKLKFVVYDNIVVNVFHKEAISEMSLFDFTNVKLISVNYESFCLIPDDNLVHNECSELYKTVKYKQSEAITEKQLNFDINYVKFYVIDSSDTFHPLLKLNTVSETKIEIKGYDKTQRISIDIEKCKEMTLINVFANLSDSVTVFDLKSFNVFWDSSFNLKGKINCNELTVFDSSWNLIQKMNQKTNVTLYSKKEVKSICCYDDYFTITTVFTRSNFNYDVLNDLSLILDHATDIKIDWGGSKTATIPFFPGINVFDKNGDIKVTFTNRWSYNNVKSLRRGYIDGHGTDITFSSDYWSFPSNVFDLSGFVNIRTKGRYCAISDNDKEQEFCPDSYTILTFSGHKLESEMLPSANDQITVCVVDNDFVFPKSIFQNFVTLFANKNINVKIYDDEKVTTKINEIHLTDITVINEAKDLKFTNVLLTDSTFSGNLIYTSNLTINNPIESFDYDIVKISNTLTLYNKANSITFGKDSFIINNFEMKYSVCPSIIVRTLELNETDLTLKANTKETINLPDFYFTLNNVLIFDDSLYYLKSRRVSQLVFTSFHNEIFTNYVVLPKVFDLKTKFGAIYHVKYGTKKPPFDYSPVPTKSESSFSQSPSFMSPTTKPTTSVENNQKPKTFFMISIMIVTTTLVFLIYNLLKKWRKFEVYNNRLEVSSDDIERRDQVITFL